MRVAEVLINIPVKSICQAYTYRVPETLPAEVGAGWRVVVPFGNGSRKREGFVVAVRDVDRLDFDVKDIIEPVDGEAWFLPTMLATATWLAGFYLCSLAEIMRLFMPGKSGVRIDRKTGKVSRRRATKISQMYADDAPPVAEPLTEEQQRVLASLTPHLDDREPFTALLFGVTDSGKTRVYIESALRVRRHGRQVIVLVPEIALTGQLVRAFQAYFRDDLVVIHSRLTVGERNAAFVKLRRGEVGIAIGARSALFTPMSGLGLIVIDEEQDGSYKQDERPRYHARVVAEFMAKLHGATLLLGSATPSLESYHRATAGDIALLTMTRRIGDKPLPRVELVDMRAELKARNFNVLSRTLLAALKETIAGGHQAIIMLNRRGYNTFVMCRECGYVVKCPDCELPMVYHANRRLSCHHCERTADVPDVCPRCGGRYIKFFGTGTEKLEAELKAQLPAARVVRLDRDTTAAKYAHRDILDAFRRHEFDVLLGTQMVAKGHDMPKVTLVGIISADSALYIPNFRSAERCFMLITQTAGRAGRGEVGGRAVVQCYNPDHYAVQSAVKHDYADFARRELKLREPLGYPPYRRLVKLTCLHKDAATAAALAATLRDDLAREQPASQVLGPAPDALPRYSGLYRFCVLVKAADLSSLLTSLRSLGLHTRDDVTIDIDPM